jgi:hypothetical protein
VQTRPTYICQRSLQRFFLARAARAARAGRRRRRRSSSRKACAHYACSMYLESSGSPRLWLPVGFAFDLVIFKELHVLIADPPSRALRCIRSFLPLWHSSYVWLQYRHLMCSDSSDRTEPHEAVRRFAYPAPPTDFLAALLRPANPSPPPPATNFLAALPPPKPDFVLSRKQREQRDLRDKQQEQQKEP